SVFTTGNIKKSVVFGTEYIYHHRQQDLKIAVNYFIVVLAFTLGAISSAIIQPFSRMKTIWVAVAIIGYTLSGMDRDSMPDFFIQKRGHLLSPRYTINSPQKS